MIFSAVRDWKTTIHCVVWILSVFFGLFILLMPTQARDYQIQASDGETYTVTLGETPDINNFSVRKSNGEILRGVTEAERDATAELYFAAKLFWHILPFYSLDAPVEDFDAWVTDIARGAIINLLVQQGADILLDGAVNGFLGTVQLLLGGNPVEIVEGWIPAALFDAVEKDAEQRLLIDAGNLAKSFAATAVDHENMLRDFYVSYETRSVIISIDEINTAWESFYIVVECKSLTTNLIHRYLQDPKSEISLEPGSLGSIAVSLLPAGKTTTTIAERVVTTTDFIGDVTDAIATIDFVNYTLEHIEKLQRVRENAGSWIYQQVLSDIKEKKKELRGALDQVGYFQPMIAPPVNVPAAEEPRPVPVPPQESDPLVPPPAEPSSEQDGTIPNENETEVTLLPNHPPVVYRQMDPQNFTVGDDPEWRNLSSYFSDPDGNMLKYKATSSDDRIVVATIEDNSVKITPGEAGTAKVTVTAEDPGGLTKGQYFWVTVRMESQTILSLPVCDRTPQVREEIMKKTRDNNCANVTEDELESIKSLSMLEEDINTLKQGDFDELRGLEELVLKGNSLETLPEDVFWYLGNLKKLSLRNNQFTILVEDTFEHLDSLTYLSLRGNRLTTLQQGAFNDLDTLIELDLSDNQLTTLPTGVFENLFNLEELTLENNNITILSSGGFLGLSSLKDLELDGNSLHTIEAGAFNGLSSLTDLDFNNHPLHTIEAGAFSGLNSLTNLELGNTELSTLSRDVFSGLSSLDDLELYENPLHTIETGAFNGLSSLRCLDLSDAQLSTLSRDVFLGLSNLESLDLDGNSLKTIEVGAFNGLSSLTSLDLCENQLTMLRVVTFSGLNNLTHLSLDENQFATLPADIFSELSELRHLNLSENQFTTLPVGVFKGLSNLTYLNLQDNPGAPFTLTLELARTDNANQTALGPATVKVKLAEGAPFEMNVSLSVEGGTLSASTATIAKGRTESGTITVTQSGIGPTTVNLGILPTIPSDYSGIRMAVGSSLVLFTGDKGPSVVVSIAPSRVESPVIGERLTLNLNIAGGEAVAGYQATVQFDASALRYVDSSKGDYLPADAFFTQTKVGENRVLLTSTSHAGEIKEDGTLATFIFEVVEVKTSILTLSEVMLSDRAGEVSFPLLENGQVVKPSQIPEDVNRDGIVNIQDLVLVASFFGQPYKKDADINGDNVVNIADLVLVANALSNAAAAPAAHSQVLDMLTAADLRQWLTQAQQLNLTDATPQRGILFLENLLAALTPKKTALLPNYPNPFNPETWIPYQLAAPADVSISIYAADGKLVRKLALGHKPVGIYQDKSRAAYWEGRNALGERVASGVYFYTLTAGDFTATRKLLIAK